ncbi:MAG: PP2C family protein-serine/threonine phosphatase, partial [Planctomycetes bacterium]|nr:PP2C family protein-serine/threonine phosphatase [Planctomycetota bacterium]
ESLAVTIAMQYELFNITPTPDVLAQLLGFALDGSPEPVQGIGVVIAPADGGERLVAYRSKNGPAREDDLRAAMDGRVPATAASAREINMNRRVRWSLIRPRTLSDGGRFASLLTVTLKCLDGDAGEVVVRADLDWLSAILADLEHGGAHHAVCVTPDQDILWLDGGALAGNPDERSVTAADRHRLQEVRRFLAGGTAPGGREFLKSEILGTGWTLVATEARPPAGALPPVLLWSLLLMALAGIVLFLDAMATPFGRGPVAPDEPSRLDGEAAAGADGLFARAHQIMFNYRMSNPEQQRIDSELRVARQIQFSLVPASFPAYSEWREFDLYPLLAPAREVGGDYYDFFMLDSDRMVLTVGDVSGKGVPAALYMAVCRTAFRTLARTTDDSGMLMSRLNDLLVRDNQSGLYVTVVTFIIDLPTGNCEYTIAGHPAPLWYHHGQNCAEFVDAPRETFIGMKAGIHFPVGTLRLQPGDTLLLYSDGVSEARNTGGEELEYAGALAAFCQHARADRCQTLIAGMEASVREFMGGLEQSDDITLLAFRYWGPGGQKMIRKRERDSVRSVAHAP